MLFRRGTRGSESARYCYSVWLRHLVRTQNHRKWSIDGIIIELGPGDSLGIGFAALLSGARQYIAIDIVQHSNMARNIAIFDELVHLFKKMEPIPSYKEFPLIKPELESYDFPSTILTEKNMSKNLAPERITAIRNSLEGNDLTSDEFFVRYINPKAAQAMIKPNSAEWIFSQAVLEHVDDLTEVYQSCWNWLKPNGIMSHDIDFKCHGTSLEWNGHWAYPDLVWWLIRGNRPYLLNREPCSTHLKLMNDAGFDILEELRVNNLSQIQSKQLARRFSRITNDDLITSSAFLVARKRHSIEGCRHGYRPHDSQ